MHGCVPSTLATDALVLKHQAIIIHGADLIFIVLYLYKSVTFIANNTREKITFWKKWPSLLSVNIETG